MSRVPTNGIDYTSKDYESFRNDMIKQLGIKMPEYTDIRQSDAGIVLLELLAQGLDVISYYQDVLANEVFLVTAEQRTNVLKWCQMLGYTPKASTPSEFTQVFVLSAVQDTDTIIPAGTKVKTKGSSTESEIYFETASDLVIPAGKLGNEMQDGEYLYTVKVVQGVSVSGELLGSSTGSPEQKFKLNYTPVIVDSIEVIINEGNGFEEWTRVDNFVDSTPTSKHYTVYINDNDEATITFGDGVFGKIPKKYENGIYCNYRVGGGIQGNVSANKIIVLDSNIALVSETFNPYPAEVEGYEKESLSDIKINAPVAHRNLWGALTAEDFAKVVKLNFPDVSLAASYFYDFDYTGAIIEMYVVLNNDAPVTEEFRKSVLELFDENKGGRKIVGVGEIEIQPAIKVPLDISISLSVKPRYDFDKVKNEITAFLEDFFSVGNYPFDTELSISELSASIMNPENAIEGIRSLRITSPSEDIISVGNGEILTLGSLTIDSGGE